MLSCVERGNRDSAAVTTVSDNAHRSQVAGKETDIEARLARLSKLLPVSQAALDVFNMTTSNGYDGQQVAAAVARDASLSADVLRMANSSFYNPSGRKVIELEMAVFRIGQRRIGEIALATGALAALTTKVLPWVDVALAWRRSVAAGVAIDLFLAHDRHAKVGEGLFPGAIMHLLGRLALGMLYPGQYQKILAGCKEDGNSLEDQEREAFHITHGQVLSRLLKVWNIPEAVYQPLEYIADPYRSLAGLAEPLRTRVELLKLAVLVGWMAVGDWECWDTVEFPDASILQRLDIGSLSETISETKSDCRQIINFRPQQAAFKPGACDPAKSTRRFSQLAYCNLSPEPFDFLAEIVSSMGIALNACEPEAASPPENVLINCLGTAPDRLAAWEDRPGTDGTVLLITDDSHREACPRLGHTISLPASYGRLRSACEDIAEKLQTAAACSA